jgi:hypothetical protein
MASYRSVVLVVETLNTARANSAGAGIQTAALGFGGLHCIIQNHIMVLLGQM